MREFIRDKNGKILSEFIRDSKGDILIPVEMRSINNDVWEGITITYPCYRYYFVERKDSMIHISNDKNKFIHNMSNITSIKMDNVLFFNG